ncbi:MAG: hypothetical protein JXQ91_04880 [Vannielia sp.]|uniref:hypothetical protein n=1 Tax=Vannielia sp. TaxID=2813045 RepID=UPI003B8B7442
MALLLLIPLLTLGFAVSAVAILVQLIRLPRRAARLLALLGVLLLTFAIAYFAVEEFASRALGRWLIEHNFRLLAIVNGAAILLWTIAVIPVLHRAGRPLGWVITALTCLVLSAAIAATLLSLTVPY